ncbi:hypothetical protein NMY22_g11166 [Coprinellus aureogranulatus]|nr:hypothetical protein NMY22_g11166 [Coprinellus aureogranulatus]
MDLEDQPRATIGDPPPKSGLDGEPRYAQSPQCMLPIEILGEIFIWTVFSVDYAELLWLEVTKICLVCATWRHVALATTRVWSHLELSARKYFRGRGPVPLNFSKIGVWLSRAHNLPKTLKIQKAGPAFVPCSALGDYCPLTDPRIHDFLTTGPIIDRLSVECDLGCVHNLVDSMKLPRLAVMQGDRPWDNIKELGIRMVRWTEEVDVETANSSVIPGELPHIPSLSLQLPPYEPHRVAPLIKQEPTSFSMHLTSISVTCNWPPFQVVEIFAACRNLTRLSLDLQHKPVEHQVEVSQPVRMHKVQSFCTQQLFSSAAPGAVPILRYLSMPVLTTLEIGFKCDSGVSYNHYGMDEWARDLPDLPSFGKDLLNFVERSQCQTTLRRLRMQSFSIASRGLSFLHTLNSLTHLTMDEMDFDSAILTDDRDPQVLLPNLEELALLRLPSFFPLDDVCTFVTRRCVEVEGRSTVQDSVGAHKLKTLVMTVLRGYLDDILAQLPSQGGAAERVPLEEIISKIKRGGVQVTAYKLP